MTSKHLAALSGNPKSETTLCAGYELTTVLTCVPESHEARAAWLVRGTLMREGMPVEADSVSDEVRWEVWRVLREIVKGVGFEDVLCGQGKYEWVVRKEMTEGEVGRLGPLVAIMPPLQS